MDLHNFAKSVRHESLPKLCSNYFPFCITRVIWGFVNRNTASGNFLLFISKIYSTISVRYRSVILNYVDSILLGLVGVNCGNMLWMLH